MNKVTNIQLLSALFVAGCFVMPVAHAAYVSTSYELALSNNTTGHISGDPLLVTNHIADGTTYATVLIEGDDAVDGMIDFTVTLSSFWDSICLTKCGIDSFGFNLLGAATSLTATDVSNLPTTSTKWFTDVSGINQDGFGSFDAVVKSEASPGGPDRQNPSLTFSIDLVGDSIEDYFALSQAGANGGFNFALHIAGFTDQNPDDPTALCTTLDANDPECNLLTSVWAANGERPAVVPVPAAVWLFGSGLLGLVGIARRKAA